MATTLLARRGGGGRPRRNRVRHAFNPRLEVAVYDELARQAAELDMSMAGYIEHLLAEAHDYHGQYIQELSVLPAPLTAQELRERTAQISRDRCVPIAGERRRKSFLVDEELAVKIAARCDELDAQYADYLRVVFREATGFADKPIPEQLSIVDVGDVRQPSREVGLRRAG